ncbi:family 78 glycoside hydrolase catalytic domain [Streptomyces sp. L7]|uniref:family 78 glycoside hydrolase catalytic domain n=1 Tax=Streptomyces sp. L7 TaxID=3423954 RepID=UPI003D975B2F
MPTSSSPTPPRFEHRTELGPILGIGTERPRLSWTVPTAPAGWLQRRYEIEIERADRLDRFEVASNDQVLVPWPGRPLISRESARVRVRVADDQYSGWSEWATVEAGLFDPADWRGSFITPTEIGGLDDAAPILLSNVDLAGRIVRARLYVTALGTYQATINGRAISDQVLAPGWTSYDHRLRYHVYDVTGIVEAGANELGFTLGNGWYRGRLGFEGRRAIYGDRLALLAQLEVTLADGSVQIHATNDSWCALSSGVVADDLYDGQTTDLRIEARTGRRHAVESVDYPKERLVAAEGPVVRPVQEAPALKVWTSPSGRTLVDFGQNIVGWVRLRTSGLAAGTTVTIRHAEVLEDGELGVRPLRTAKATDSYVMDGGPDRILEPAFTLHGFRFAEVTGVPHLTAADITAIVVASDLRRTGWFESSNTLLDRLHENVVWSMRGNFIDLPTDCPQRDERLGWTGDAQVFAPTAFSLFDTAGLLSSWLADLAAEQWPDGTVPYVVPDVIGAGSPPSPTAAWGDASTIIPWTMFERSGDSGILERQYPSMRRWVDRIAAAAGDRHVWDQGFQFGDWLDPAAPPDDPARAMTDPALVATAYLARSAHVLAATAAQLGYAEDHARYARLADETRAAFSRRFVTADGRMESDSPTAYAVAIVWDLFADESQRSAAGRRLADLVRAGGFRISTGFVGTPVICDALTSTGHAQVAHRLLLQTGCPSWLYPVTMGATSMWERWDSMLPDGTINPGEMTSFNHFALGAVADWLHRSVAGLVPLAPGYRRIRIEPVPPADLDFASTTHRTPYGDARVAWRRNDGRLLVTAHIPVGAEADVKLPDGSRLFTVAHGDHEWAVDREPGDPTPATIRDLVDDAPNWSVLLRELSLAGIGFDTETKVAGRLLAFFDQPLTELAQALAPEGATLPDTRARVREITLRVTAKMPDRSAVLEGTLG